MPKSSLSVFKKSLLAAAIVTATGCASTAPNSSGGGFGDTLIRTGAATADLTARAWHRTGYWLGLNDDGGSTNRADDRFANEQQLANNRFASELDEVDLALMEEDAVMPGSNADADTIQTASTRIERAITEPAVRVGETDVRRLSSADAQVTALQADDLGAGKLIPRDFEGTLPEDSFDTRVKSRMAAADPENLPLDNTDESLNLQTVALEDYIHEVGQSETLWDIAKATTGDATNWHIIADINDLNPNASVFVGQSLVIPADMVKPEFAGAPVANEPVLAADTSKRLAIPAAPATAEVQPAVAELATDVPAESARVVLASDAAAADPVTAPIDDAFGFEIEAGETLWDFAKRTTGDATYWQAIAAHNGFSEQQAVAVRQGQEIFVPDVLVRPELAPAPTQVAALDATTPVATQEPVAVAALPSEADTELNRESVDAGAAVLAGTNGLNTDELVDTLDPVLEGERDITIVEAAFRGDSDVDLGSDVDAAQPAGEVIISGTYYPKAIYNGADFSSSLLMRVSPGTALTVSKVDGAWYEVETDQGTGFVHQRDVK